MSPSRLENPPAPRVQKSPAILIAGMRERFTYDRMQEIPGLWQRFSPYIGTQAEQVERTAYGVVFAMKPEVDYMAGVQVSSATGAFESLDQVTIPAQQYLVFGHEGHVSKIPETVTTIFQEWLPTSGQTVGDFPAVLERYGEQFNPHTGTGGMEIWVPLKS
jgi:AraC family transcriptional regulator